MVDVVLYIACSLDGYIATPEGGVEWLSQVEAEGEDYGYQAFFDSVDALVMGSRTYRQVLDFGEWPYGDKPCWVMSRQSLLHAGSVHFSQETIEELLNRLHAQGVKRLWLVGGAALVDSFERAGGIHQYIISWVPHLPGDGVPLFTAGRPPRDLKLIDSRSYPSGLVQLHYHRQNHTDD